VPLGEARQLDRPFGNVCGGLVPVDGGRSQIFSRCATGHGRCSQAMLLGSYALLQTPCVQQFTHLGAAQGLDCSHRAHGVHANGLSFLSLPSKCRGEICISSPADSLSCRSPPQTRESLRLRAGPHLLVHLVQQGQNVPGRQGLAEEIALDLRAALLA
jgi:hypothetical protein